MQSRFIFIAALTAMLAVMAGAFGAHALKKVLSPEMLAVYKTAVNYQMWHALGLGLIGMLIEFKGPDKLLYYAGWLMLSGLAIFSGSLYLLTLSNLKWLGMITPIGGLAMIVAWFLLALACWRMPGSEKGG